MHTEPKKHFTLTHPLAQVDIRMYDDAHKKVLLRLIRVLLDSYLEGLTQSDNIPAEEIHRAIAARHGDFYETAGYNLKLYRNRADLTQAALSEKSDIKQHHLSEMENNKRSIGKKLAMKLAKILKMDYRELL